MGRMAVVASRAVELRAEGGVCPGEGLTEAGAASPERDSVAGPTEGRPACVGPCPEADPWVPP